MAKPATGRPSQLTPEVKRKLLEAIRAGSHYEPACAYAGIAYSTFRDWMQRGAGTHKKRAKSDEFVEFVEAVQEAEAQGELQMVASINAASKNDWRAAAWSLERRHSDRWANTQKVRVLVEQQVEAEINMLFEAIAADSTIPDDAKRKIFESAAQIQERAASNSQN